MAQGAPRAWPDRATGKSIACFVFERPLSVLFRGTYRPQEVMSAGASTSSSLAKQKSHGAVQNGATDRRVP